MPTIQLTDRTLAGLAPEAGAPRTNYFDRTLPGFGIRVGAQRKTFLVFYRTPEGRLRQQTLGRYPALSLATARERAQAVLRKADGGRDPATEQHQARTQTFEALATLYLERHAKVKKKFWRDDQRMIKCELLPAWTGRPVASLRRVEVRALLEGVVDRGAPVLANRVLALVRKMLNFALDREWVESNVAAKMPRPTPDRKRERVLTAEEIRVLWAWLSRPAPDTADAAHWRLAQAALKLRLLTAQRGEELLTMQWAHVEIETGWWTIPSAHAKNGLAHRVFLAPAALALLTDLRSHAAKDATLVFRGIRGPRHRRAALTGVPLDNFQPKDLRRTAATHMTAGGVDRQVVRKVLNHVEREITAVYDRYSYDAEKRAALTWWAVKLEAILAGTAAKVLPFARG